QRPLGDRGAGLSCRVHRFVRARRPNRQRPVCLCRTEMKRSASLDFLRGVAAFAVAIPHYLTANAQFQPFAESFAIAGVEVFFVLSGFVLAPQIVDWVVDKPSRNLGVFLA